MLIPQSYSHLLTWRVSIRLLTAGWPQVRSHLWPGYVFDHAVDGKQFAGAYIGNGVRQDDVAFML